MYQPLNLKLKNIGTIRDIDYDFQIGTTRLFVGKNLQDQGQKNNGVGKSSFIDGIGFGLTGVSLRGLVLHDLITDNEKEAEIHLTLQTIDKSRTLIIRRFLSRKSPQRIEIYLNGVALHENLHDVDACNTTILDEIGIAKEDLFQFFILTNKRYKPFFALSDNDKKAVANRFSKGDKVDNVFPLIDTEIGTHTTQRNTLTLGLQRNIGTIEGYNRTLVQLREKESTEAKEALKTQINEELDLLREGVVELQTIIDEFDPTIYDEEIAKYQKQSDECQTTLDTFPTLIQQIYTEKDAALKGIRDKIEEQEVELKEMEDSSVVVRNELNTLGYTQTTVRRSIEYQQLLLQDAISCPACEHQFVMTEDKSSVEDIQNELIRLNGEYDEVTLKYTDALELRDMLGQVMNDQRKVISNLHLEIKSKSVVFDSKIQQLNTQQRETSYNQQQAINALRMLDKQKSQHLVAKTNTEVELQTINRRIDDALERFASVDKNSFADTILETEKAVITLEESNNLLNQELEECEKQIAQANEWTLKFKNFKSYLANQSLKVLEHHTNNFLAQMNTNLTVELSAYKKVKNKVTEKMTATIARNGLSEASYARFSGGERGRIDIGVIMANQTLINNNAARGLDFLLIDEVLDAVDALGTESVVRAMSKINKTMILVSQLDINSVPEHTTTLIKQNGATTIE